MKRASLLLCFLWAILARADPQDAVVRVTSHGASATVIWTGPGRTLLLGCAHAHQGKDYTKRIAVDAPAPRPGASRTGGIRILKIDYQLDLTLVEIGIGPLPYVCPVASAGHKPRSCISVGYDNGTTPVTIRRASILGDNALGTLTYTRESPWHGRSGGALIDHDSGVLVGVVKAYETDRAGRQIRGVYVSHKAVRRFLGYQDSPKLPRLDPPMRRYQEASPTPYCPDCPEGVCPSPQPL